MTAKDLWLRMAGITLIVAAVLATVACPPSAPVFSPVPDASQSYNCPITVTLGTATPNATMYYTTDGSIPSRTSATSTQYNGQFAVSQSTPVKALAETQSGSPPQFSDSPVTSGSYVCKIVPPQPPVLAPAPSISSAYDCPLTVTLAEATPGATVFFTLDGTAPSSNSTPYDPNNPIILQPGARIASTTIRSIAHLGPPNPVDSSETEGFYTCKPAAPPAAFDQIEINIYVGNDNARQDSEVTAALSGQSSSICLKPSNNGQDPTAICGQNSSAPEWKNWNTYDQTFTLPTPQASTAGFGTITLTLLAFPGTFENEDRWQIEAITVTALDSHRALAPTVLLDLGNRTTNSGDNTCYIDLDSKTFPTITLSLNGGSNPAPNCAHH